MPALPHRSSRRQCLAGPAALALMVSLSGCLLGGYHGTQAEVWVHPELDELGPQRYAVLPVDCPDEVIPSDAYRPWRRKRRLELTLHLRRVLAEELADAGHHVSDSGLVEAALGRGDLDLPASVRLLDGEQRAELALRLRADAVVETRILDGSPERLTVALRAVHLVTGELLWSSNRTDNYTQETGDQVERMIERSLTELHRRGL